MQRESLTKLSIYGILFLAILFAWQWGLEWNRDRNRNVKEGFAKANPNLAKTDTVKPDPEPTPADAALKSKNASKLSACGDTCDTYDNIKTALESFKKLEDKQKNSSEAVSKVDQDIIKLSESVKNMGNSKVPGGRPVVTKEMM
jgi:hypothetical protein